MRKNILISGILAIVICLNACKKADDVTPKTDHTDSSKVLKATANCEPVINKFYGGQHHLVGDITVSNDNTNLIVTFNTTGGWEMKMTQLYVGPLKGLPATPDGNPKIGNFPYKSAHSPSVTSFTYTIPLSSLGKDDCIIIAGHAEVFLIGENGEVQQAETAWGAGKPMNSGGSWASYSDYCICKNPNSGPTPTPAPAPTNPNPPTDSTSTPPTTTEPEVIEGN